MCEPLLQALAEDGVHADAVYLEGEDPAATISGLATKLEADIVVLGPRGPSSIRRRGRASRPG